MIRLQCLPPTTLDMCLSYCSPNHSPKPMLQIERLETNETEMGEIGLFLDLFFPVKLKATFVTNRSLYNFKMLAACSCCSSAFVAFVQIKISTAIAIFVSYKDLMYVGDYFFYPRKGKVKKLTL